MIPHSDVTSLMRAVGTVVRSASESNEQKFNARIAELEHTIRNLEVIIRATQLQPGPKGEAGSAGEMGPQGARGADGKDGKDGINGKDGSRGLDGAPGKDGINGRDGRDGLSIPGPVGPQGERGVQGPQGRDGLSIPGPVGPQGERGVQGPQGRDGLQGERGVAGADGQIVDVEFIPSPDDPRELTIRSVLSEGRIREVVIRMPMLMDAGVYSGKEEYQRGDCVTHEGSGWVCQTDKTRTVPGRSEDWRLMVKRGKDGRSGERGEPGPQGPPGQDLRYK